MMTSNMAMLRITNAAARWPILAAALGLDLNQGRVSSGPVHRGPSCHLPHMNSRGLLACLYRNCIKMEPDRDRLPEQARRSLRFRVNEFDALIMGRMDEMERRTELDQHSSQQEHDHT